MSKIIELYNKISINIKRSFLRFFLSFFLAWIVTVLFNDFPFFSTIIKNTNIDLYLLKLTIWLSEFMLNIIGFETWSEGKILRIYGHPGIRLEYACLGIRHIMLFISFIILYFGNIYRKLWYIPLGISILVFVNALRGAIISISQYLNPNATELVHDISTPILMYTTILFLWIFWINMHLKAD